ncbi:hypothetical protein GCM10010357_57570 [Streptomyces luteireticuli]|uniref:Uncharacterized protein n=1 Tax=Streptomyces luteireticuli TaxID=173858 RepID=A0ABN0Z180_9ACTN
MAEHDVAPDADLLRAEPEGQRLYGQRVVHPRGEVERPDHDVIHARRLPGRQAPPDPGQNSTLMNAPSSTKPTRRYAARAAAL